MVAGQPCNLWSDDMTSYVVALEKDVRDYSIVRSMMGDKPLVIWRGASGAINVWLDRCPHRFVRLSAGRNMGGYLEGVYHGWQFEESGKVMLVPAMQGRPAHDISATVYSTAVAGGFVWASEEECSPRAVQASRAIQSTSRRRSIRSGCMSIPASIILPLGASMGRWFTRQAIRRKGARNCQRSGADWRSHDTVP